MRFIRPLLRFQHHWLWAVFVVAPVSALAATANFGNFQLSPGFEPNQGIGVGYTGGTYSLSAITNHDRLNNVCLGFATPTPDHIIVLQKDFSALSIKINSGGYDTTLMMKGPNDNDIWCGDDTGSSKDASIDATNLKAGTYQVWVGSFKSGLKFNYNISVQQPQKK